jgi:hypothetical protein
MLRIEMRPSHEQRAGKNTGEKQEKKGNANQSSKQSEHGGFRRRSAKD